MTDADSKVRRGTQEYPSEVGRLSTALKDFRKDHGISQRALGAYLKCSQTRISQLERGADPGDGLLFNVRELLNEYSKDLSVLSRIRESLPSTRIQCVQCSTIATGTGSRFCSHCGARLPMVCECGRENLFDSDYCGSCSRPLFDSMDCFFERDSDLSLEELRDHYDRLVRHRNDSARS